MTTEWYRFFWNIYGFTGTGVVPVDKGGTGLDTIGDHQIIIGNTNNVFEPALLRGFGINVTYDPGFVNLSIGASGVTPGTYGTASQVGVFTVNEYGVLTAASNTSIAIDATQIISGTIASARISGSYTGITGVGTLTTGTWNASTIGVLYGGTGASTAAGARANLSAAILGTNNDITSMTAITGGISSPDFIQFDTTYATTLAAGQLGWDGNDTLGLGMIGGNVIQHIGEDQFFYCKATATITKGQVVMFTGAVGASGVPTGAPATGITDGTYIMGIAAENIANNGFGLVQSFGTLRNVNTSGYADGDILWYNPAVAGGLTKTKPVAPNVKAQMAAVINGGSSGGGTILIRINPGSILGGTDSNAEITTPANGNILTYDGADSYWKNTVLTAGSGVSISTSATGVLTISATGTGGTVTSVSGTSPISVATGTTTPVISISQATTSTNGYLSSTDWNTFNNKQPAGSYLTAVSVVSANGFAGTSSGGTTPALTFSTTITGLLKGNGTAISAATSGTDYAPATSGTSILYGNGAGGFSNVTIGTGVSFAGGTLSATGSGGTVTSVAALTLGTTGTDLSSTVANSTTTPVITLNVPTASAANRGALSAADWTTFNSKVSSQWVTTGSNIYYNTGNIGVGTTSPNSYAGYGVATFNGTTGGLLDLSVGGTRTGSLYANASQVNLSSRTAIPIVFETNATEKMRLSSAGYVGIGTNAPGTYLDFGTPYGGAGTINKISLYNPSTPQYGFGISAQSLDYVTAVSAQHAWYTGGSSPVQAMQLNSTGLVIGGTTNPVSAKLKVVGIKQQNATSTGAQYSNVPVKTQFGKSSGQSTSSTVTVVVTANLPTFYSWAQGMVKIRAAVQNAYSGGYGGYDGTYTFSAVPGAGALPRDWTLLGTAATNNATITVTPAGVTASQLTITVSMTDGSVPGAVPWHELWVWVEFYTPWEFTSIS